ncbi:hypothetical protein [Halosimplex sp. TS25]|uniref:hypothetical protein n=1 Tax=Halosimplex rarum TaxID=3396619 RepID=UPI0039E82D93
MPWRDLFERADGREVTVEDVREAIARRREGGEDGDGTGVGAGTEEGEGEGS